MANYQEFISKANPGLGVSWKPIKVKAKIQPYQNYYNKSVARIFDGYCRTGKGVQNYGVYLNSESGLLDIIPQKNCTVYIFEMQEMYSSQSGPPVYIIKGDRIIYKTTPAQRRLNSWNHYSTTLLAGHEYHFKSNYCCFSEICFQEVSTFLVNDTNLLKSYKESGWNTL